MEQDKSAYPGYPDDQSEIGESLKFVTSRTANLTRELVGEMAGNTYAKATVIGALVGTSVAYTLSSSGILIETAAGLGGTLGFVQACLNNFLDQKVEKWCEEHIDQGDDINILK